MAHAARFAISVLAIVAAAALLMHWRSDWAWVVAITIFLAGGGLAEFAFRRLATSKTIQEDLEERVRNQHL